MIDQDPTAHRQAWFAPMVFAVAIVLALFVRVDPNRFEHNRQYQLAVQSMVDDRWFEISTRDFARVVTLREDGLQAEEFARRQAIVEAFAKLPEHMLQDKLWKFDDSQGSRGAPVIGFVSDGVLPDLFRSSETWSGQIAFARTHSIDVAALMRLDAPGRIELLPAQNVREKIESDFAVVRIDRQPEPVVRDDLVGLQCGTGMAAYLYRLGGEIAIRSAENPDCQVWIGLRPLGNSRFCVDRSIPEDRCPFGFLGSADSVSISALGQTKPLATFQRRHASSQEMLMRRGADKEDKIIRPEFRGLVDALTADIAVAMPGCKRNGLALGCEEDMTFAIDLPVQEVVEQAIAAAPAPTNRFAAAVVMNSRTGEVIAMAGKAQPASKNCAHPALCAFPVGSVAKPIFATAMIGSQQEIDLSTLRIRHRGGTASDILGLPFAQTPLNNTNSGGDPDGIDLEEFIYRSDNHYAAGLALLASPASGSDNCPMSAGDWYQIEGRRISGRRPRSQYESADCRLLSDRLPLPLDLSWGAKLADYFDLDPFSKTAAPSDFCSSRDYYGDRNFDASPWSSLYAQGATDRCLIKQAGLERQWMQIERERNFRIQAIPLILGNNTGRFSTVKLAEAFARLATGRAVRASFLSLRDNPSFRQIDFRGPRSDPRVAVSRGMARVLEGTAAPTELPAVVRALQARAEAKGYRLGVFAKTGTMQLTGAAARSCPDSDNCEGKAFAATFALYSARIESLSIDARTGRVMDAAIEPNCAVTIAVNLPQFNGFGANAAANVTAEILASLVGERLLETDGEFCAG